MKKARKIVALVMVFALVCMMVPAASAESEALSIETGVLGNGLSTSTLPLDEFIKLAESKSQISSRAVITPLTAVSTWIMYYGVCDFNFMTGDIVYYTDYFGAEEFSPNVVGKRATGSGAPDIIGDYMFRVVESGYSVSWRNVTWNGSGANTDIIGVDYIFNGAGVSVGAVQWCYVDNNDAQTTTTGTFNFTAHNYDPMYGGDYSRSDWVSVV